MGYFTWKDSQDRRKSVGYGKPVYVICPDDSVIAEDSYQGYGMFNRFDIYKLAVEWNRPYLKEIFDRKEKEDPPDYFGHELYPVAVAAMESDEKAREVVEELRGKIPEHLITPEGQWKRSIGIAISRANKDNESLPYPIKMSSTIPAKPYKKLRASWQTQ